MDIRANTIQALLLGLMLVFPATAFSVPEAGEAVTKRGTINDDYYAAGGTVNIDADIVGDLVVSGGEVFIGHRVQGDVMAAGGIINIGGEILDDVRSAGGEITIDANIGDDLFAAGGTIRVTSASSTGGEVWLAGGDVHVAGTVDKDLHIAAGNIRLSGTIRGDVELVGEEIHILEGALIEGDLLYKSPHEAKISPDAKVAGNITYEHKSFAKPHKGYGIFFSITLIVASVVLFLIFPGFTKAAATRISNAPWKSFGVGFTLLFITPIAAALLMMTVLGIWVGLSVLALYFVALIVGLLISFFFLGDWGARRLGQDVTTRGRRLLSVAIVIIIFGLIQYIPVIGGLLVFLLLMLGLGAGSLQLRYAYNQSDRT